MAIPTTPAVKTTQSTVTAPSSPEKYAFNDLSMLHLRFSGPDALSLKDRDISKKYGKTKAMIGHFRGNFLLDAFTYAKPVMTKLTKAAP
jgi:hypothetical protein